MSAELLRKAASEMRRKAEAATPGPWFANLGGYVEDRPFLSEDGNERLIADTWNKPGNAPHIASWHPAVALAVADWLDLAASDVWAWGPPCPCGTGCDVCDDNEWEPHYRRALAVARAFLGG